jgi:hypothetical protein
MTMPELRAALERFLVVDPDALNDRQLAEYGDLVDRAIALLERMQPRH